MVAFKKMWEDVYKMLTEEKFNELDIREIVKLIDDHGINVAANYIFGFPIDNFKTMQQTLDLACELNTAFANFYTCMALPGSPLYLKAINNGWKLPDSYEGYAFFSYDCLPLPTDYISAADVLKFRDEAWQTYHTRTEYLDLIQRKFGKEQRNNIEDLTKIKIKRKLLGD